MTNEEAIKVLKTSSWMCLSNNSIKFQEAIEHAYNNLKRIKILSEENTKLKAEIEQLKSELEQSVKIPERRRERKTEEYEFGVLGKGFDAGWNSCLDMLESLKGQV